MGRHSLGVGATLAAVALAAALLSGCSLFPSTAPSLTPTRSSSGSQGGSSISLILPALYFAHGKIGPPLTTACSAGGSTVALHGAFGPETVSILLSGLHRGRHYQFAAYQAPVPATVRLTATGPVPPATGSGPHNDYLKPNGAVEGTGSGTLSVSAQGTAGSLDVTLAFGDQLSGHWACGARRTVGLPNRLIIQPATVPPALNECWVGDPFDNAPTTCPNGDINLASWPGSRVGAARVVSAVATLTRNASVSAVEVALCQDQRHASAGGGTHTQLLTWRTSTRSGLRITGGSSE
jgi:hypothetical protein